MTLCVILKRRKLLLSQGTTGPGSGDATKEFVRLGLTIRYCNELQTDELFGYSWKRWQVSCISSNVRLH